MKNNMNRGVSETLLGYLQCPDCRGDLKKNNEQLTCLNCRHNFQVKCGVPLLYPADIETTHLVSEEALADMMTRELENSQKAFLSKQQWKLSKEEFWSIVKQSINSPPNSIINLGCGYDDSFSAFQRDGFFFVNFDIVQNMLIFLKEKYSANETVAGDISSLPFRNNSFDYVVCIDIIHHEYFKLENTLKEITRILKPEGLLFLEDVNSMSIYQIPKTILLPKKIHALLRKTYHTIKNSKHYPAFYEFPTNPITVSKLLGKIGFNEITFHPLSSYPNCSPFLHGIYSWFAGWERFRTHHNFHYFIQARKN